MSTTETAMSQVGYKVSIVGASGAVGKELMKVIESRSKEGSFPVASLRLYGSPRSAGTIMESTVFGSLIVELFSVEAVRAACPSGFCFLAVSGSFALKHAKAIGEGTDGPIVIDNSSAFRYDPDIPLVVPEINGDTASDHKLIANPNCTTAIGVMAVAPLLRKYGMKRLIMSTYQAASGAGQEGMDELVAGTGAQLQALADQKDKGMDDPSLPATEHAVFAHPLPFNVIPHIDKFQTNGYTKEEMKVAWETRKICGLPESTRISCTAVRIPTLRAHSEAIVMETEQPIKDLSQVRSLIDAAPGIDLVDDPEASSYPMPLTATGRYNVQAGRFRRALAFEHGLEFFVSGDQLLRGAALNAVLVAEHLHSSGAVSP